MTIPFSKDLAFEYGVAHRVAPKIRRIVSKNPSPFTLYGTGTYIVGEGDVAVIDPGPDDPAHIDAIVAELAGETLTHILVTHTHRDHSPGTKLLQAAMGGESYGFGPHGSGRPEPGVEVEEGGDHDFTPNQRLRDGDIVEGAGFTVEAVHTPGHCSNHMCFRLREERILFCGDHVMGWSTTVVAPPDGDMQAYMKSLRKLLGADDTLYVPTHGPTIANPDPFVEAYIAHREDRERQILDCLDRGVSGVTAMVKDMYADVDPRLHPAATRSVLAHLIHLVETGRAESDGPPTLDAAYAPGRR
ncbi:MAG: MBL fold metallo-hydrolase [Proteobacteria bacterium]|nr:MBL fold metallo-hydrolase [Pseudomonadota bacterium]